MINQHFSLIALDPLQLCKFRCRSMINGLKKRFYSEKHGTNLRSSAFICSSFFADAPRFLAKSSLTIEKNILNTFTQLGGVLNIPLSIKASKAYEKMH